jgi:hypothetical protein
VIAEHPVWKADEGAIPTLSYNYALAASFEAYTSALGAVFDLHDAFLFPICRVRWRRAAGAEFSSLPASAINFWSIFRNREPSR